MTKEAPDTIEALIVAVPETAGSALYGMIDVLSAAGNLWQVLVGVEPELTQIRPRIISPSLESFVFPSEGQPNKKTRLVS